MIIFAQISTIDLVIFLFAIFKASIFARQVTMLVHPRHPVSIVLPAHLKKKDHGLIVLRGDQFYKAKKRVARIKGYINRS
jgi:hypothetical protein